MWNTKQTNKLARNLNIELYIAIIKMNLNYSAESERILQSSLSSKGPSDSSLARGNWMTQLVMRVQVFFELFWVGNSWQSRCSCREAPPWPRSPDGDCQSSTASTPDAGRWWLGLAAASRGSRCEVSVFPAHWCCSLCQNLILNFPPLLSLPP